MSLTMNTLTTSMKEMKKSLSNREWLEAPIVHRKQQLDSTQPQVLWRMNHLSAWCSKLVVNQERAHNGRLLTRIGIQELSISTLYQEQVTSSRTLTCQPFHRQRGYQQTVTSLRLESREAFLLLNRWRQRTLGSIQRSQWKTDPETEGIIGPLRLLWAQ